MRRICAGGGERAPARLHQSAHSIIVRQSHANSFRAGGEIFGKTVCGSAYQRERAGPKLLREEIKYRRSLGNEAGKLILSAY